MVKVIHVSKENCRESFKARSRHGVIFLLLFTHLCCLPQGLNPGKAIAEIKKMMATYKEKKVAAV